MVNPNPVIEKSTSGILPGVYRYTYVMNNPLKYTDPCGFVYRYSRYVWENSWEAGIAMDYQMQSIYNKGYYYSYGGGGMGGYSAMEKAGVDPVSTYTDPVTGEVHNVYYNQYTDTYYYNEEITVTSTDVSDSDYSSEHYGDPNAIALPGVDAKPVTETIIWKRAVEMSDESDYLDDIDVDLWTITGILVDGVMIAIDIATIPSGEAVAGIAGRKTLWASLKAGLKRSAKRLHWGKNAKGHLIRHADALGYRGYSPQELQRFLPELKSAANQLYNSADPALTRVGQWHQYQNARMYISNGKMLVTQSDGTFITVINKTSNNWYQLGKPLN